MNNPDREINAFSPNRIGGLRYLAAYLLTGDDRNEGYIKWLERGTDAVKADAEKQFDKWFERTFEYKGRDYKMSNEATDIIRQFLNANKQAAFEEGARTGAQLVMELMGIRFARDDGGKGGVRE